MPVDVGMERRVYIDLGDSASELLHPVFVKPGISFPSFFSRLQEREVFTKAWKKGMKDSVPLTSIIKCEM